METGAEELIHQWLAEVQEGPPSQPDCEGWDATDVVPNGGLLPVLEPTDASPAIRWPKINKRPRDDNADPPGQRDLQDKTGNQYEKRSRRKTRDDKYEYKRPSSLRNRPSEPHKDKGKRSRKSRKHTMNDAFHATNVARDRLTLRNTMNMGMFSKGKASSPIKLRDVPGPAFSEAQFLSQMGRGQSGAVTGKGTTFDESLPRKQPDGIHPHPKISHHIFREPSKLVNTESSIVHRANSSVRSSQGDQCRLSPVKGLVPSLSAAGSTTAGRLENVLGGAHDTPSQLRRSAQESPSGTPYSWSVSDRHGSRQSREVEDRLLKILHVGLSPQKFGHRDEPVDSMNEYCNIQDLKNLLKSRKACLQPEASLGLQSLGKVPIYNKTHKFISRLSGSVQSPIKGSISRLQGPNAVLMSETRTGARQTSSDDIYHESRCNQFLSVEVDVSKDVSLSSQSRLQARVDPKLANLHIKNDDIFIQKLDAAYCAIFKPEIARHEPLEKEHAARSKSHHAISYQAHDYASAFCHNQDPSPVGSIDTSLCDQLGLDAFTTFGNSSHRPQEELAAFDSHSNSRKRNASELISTREGVVRARAPEVPLKSHQGNLLASKSVPESCSPIPPGFWKQKKLY